jgi:hypothetical protein
MDLGFAADRRYGLSWRFTAHPSWCKDRQYFSFAKRFENKINLRKLVQGSKFKVQGRKPPPSPPKGGELGYSTSRQASPNEWRAENGEV